MTPSFEQARKHPDRTSGVLLHPTSLPGRLGIGSLGSSAADFVAALQRMGQAWWQMLPIGPTGYGDSPYQSPSTFAGNPLLIDLSALADLVDPAIIEAAPVFPDHTVDFGRVIPWHMEVLATATARLVARPTGDLAEFEERHGEVWLDDFALFTALKRHHRLAPWWEWSVDLVHRDPAALHAARHSLADRIAAVKAEQFLFDVQFRALRELALTSGIRLIGDIPIFVAHDSADVWANPELFFLDTNGLPTVVAGVPPDYFSETGQRWGNPLYDWERHRADGFAWWTARLRRVFDLFDLVRVDHFRGFAASWHIPADEATAVNGTWVEAPGLELFDHLLAVFGRLPVIAEDLGVITPDVEELRDRYNFPGMKILQFGFGTESAHALDQFRPNVVAYTGTHDNDTAVGWFEDPRPDRVAERNVALEMLDSDGEDFHWDLIEGVMSSVADTAVIPLQDLLGLGTHARMNTPATTLDNWRWRFRADQLTPEIEQRMAELTQATGRVGR
jgi:4-alpha-glucanotransferase